MTALCHADSAEDIYSVRVGSGSGVQQSRKRRSGATRFTFTAAAPLEGASAHQTFDDERFHSVAEVTPILRSVKAG
jgi:hypothetical protein